MQNFSEIQALMKSDLEMTDDILINRLNSNVELINQMSHYIISSGGKRIRPLLLLLCARATSYSGKDHHAMAVVIELIHTATLLHDDVLMSQQLVVDRIQLMNYGETLQAFL